MWINFKTFGLIADTGDSNETSKPDIDIYGGSQEKYLLLQI